MTRIADRYGAGEHFHRRIRQELPEITTKRVAAQSRTELGVEFGVEFAIEFGDRHGEVNSDVHGNRCDAAARAARARVGRAGEMRAEDQGGEGFGAAFPHGGITGTNDVGVGYGGVDRAHDRVRGERIQPGDQRGNPVKIG